ncbi:hypothetical protein HBA55_16635 [Pseudomaricurvus alkylphenolicus]|uniref:hypothetical protein n=1 Tax=Pseudomaricurvus alkylphenolicus TaxID=1306991 RepID=UPI00141FE7BF|nr:hypothetical protein [Pseudomaricurvus alkylphenolicus]NIB41232.1 hypothetical protein [Pseudomaricurvus alkylphenolicus]
MNKTVGVLFKVQLLAFYAVAAISPWVDVLSAYQDLFLKVVLVLAVAHMLEFLVVRKRFEGLPGGGFGHFLQTLLFGFLYWLPLFRARSGVSESH